MLMTYLQEYLHTIGIYFVYILFFAVILIPIRFFTKIPDYIFRKLLHIVAAFSVFPLAYFTDIWWISVLVVLTYLLGIIVMLLIHERAPFYPKLFVEKKRHEVLFNFLGFFLLLAALFSIFWGLWGLPHRFIAVCSIIAWAPGDGMAAIIGISVGRHTLSGDHIEGTKTVEGTAAMGITTFICTFLFLLLRSPFPSVLSLAAALLIGIAGAFTELFTKRGWDTITVPAVASTILSVFCLLFRL